MRTGDRCALFQVKKCFSPLPILADEVYWSDACDALEGSCKVRGVVVAHLVGYLLDGSVAVDEE